VSPPSRPPPPGAVDGVLGPPDGVLGVPDGVLGVPLGVPGVLGDVEGVDGVVEGDVDGAVDGTAAVTTFSMETLQVATAPPPLADPLHWLTVTGNAAEIVDAVATVHRTRPAPPPPLTDPLHWVTVALVVS
jgi:hypothetical protein